MRRPIVLVCLVSLLLAACAAPRTVVVVVTATPQDSPTAPVSAAETIAPTVTSEPTAAPLAAAATSTLPAAPTGAPAASETPPPAPLSWEEASRHVGKEVTVCGPVMDAHYAETSNGKPTFINIGKAYPDPARLTIVIWGHDRDEFSADPAQLYLDQTICVSGLIEEYQGLIEIEVSDPAQIEIQ
jgi:hypothetical protein